MEFEWRGRLVVMWRLGRINGYDCFWLGWVDYCLLWGVFIDMIESSECESVYWSYWCLGWMDFDVVMWFLFEEEFY